MLTVSFVGPDPLGSRAANFVVMHNSSLFGDVVGCVLRRIGENP
jgi:hypothetical protein